MWWTTVHSKNPRNLWPTYSSEQLSKIVFYGLPVGNWRVEVAHRGVTAVAYYHREWNGNTISQGCWTRP
jgi:hypothetical protein